MPEIAINPHVTHVTFSFPTAVVADLFIEWMKHEGEFSFTEQLAYRHPEEAPMLAEFSYLDKQRLISAGVRTL